MKSDLVRCDVTVASEWDAASRSAVDDIEFTVNVLSAYEFLGTMVCRNERDDDSGSWMENGQEVAATKKPFELQ